MLDLFLLVIAIATGAPGAEPTPPVATPAASPVTPAQLPPASESKEAREVTSSEAPPPGAAPKPAPEPEQPYTAEQQVATGRFLTALEVKPILAATRANWIAVREFDGKDLVYVTHIWSWRCGLVAMRLGINGADPEDWPLPKCHEETNAPNAMLPDDGLPYRSFPLKSIETVTVELIYDDLTTETVRFNRLGAMIP